MSLFDEPAPPAAAATRLRAAHDFVSQCISWAEGEIGRREADGRSTAEWENYLRFSRHTLTELEAGSLDAWFEAPLPGGRDKL